MINLSNGKLIESVNELPNYAGCKRLFMDVETKNNTQGEINKRWSGLYPWKGDRIAGISVTADDQNEAFYIPTRHTRGNNLPPEAVARWMQDTLNGVEEWANHNILIDMVFAHFEGVSINCRIADTLTLSKVHDSDRLGHGLDQLGKDWLNWDFSSYLRVQAFLDVMGSRDYGAVPPDIMGVYAINDVRCNRALMQYLIANRPPELAGIWETEMALTPVLFDCEIQGLLVNPHECRVDAKATLTRMLALSEEIEQLTEREWTNSWQCIYDILINQYGLPILLTKKERDEETGEEVDTGRAMFDKVAMPMYEIHPAVKANAKLQRVITCIREYRKESQHHGLFLQSFLELHDQYGLIHPTYNQIVRTGRTSCKRPNAQQQNERSKRLIHPRAGMGLLSCDYSQIEYRLIAHYINDPEIIRAYRDNPDTDFHKWVADLLKVKRKAGKTINFGMAYGMGKKKTKRSLMQNPDIMEEVGDAVNQLIEAGELGDHLRGVEFERRCEQRASEVFEEYHERIPGIKSTSHRAAEVAARRGYVFNAYGRRRYLPVRHSRKAFNSIVQGCAMDIMKERMVALSPRYNPKMKSLGIRIAANVHDEVLFEGPQEALASEEVQNYIIDELQTPKVKFNVPIICGLGLSFIDWAQAASDKQWVDKAGKPRFGKLRGTPDKVIQL